MERRTFWTQQIAKELRYIIVIIWYIKVDLMRTRQLPEYVTMSHINKIPALRADIQKQALTTYNSVFRNPEQSRFVAADTGNKTIDGHRGTILFYD